MGDPLSIAVSGLNAASRRLSAAASNIANSQDTAPLNPQPGQPQGYQPVTVVQAMRPDGGTTAQEQPVAPPNQAIFDPGSPYADSEGEVAAPNTDMAQQLTDTMTAQLSYEANAKVIEVARQQQGYLLNLFT